MQYDLFHAYTVDAHTLFVVSNLRRLAIPKFNHEFPALSQIMQSLPRQELAYLAALFHDIAKGRGGDHSELGAVDAEAFCLEQGLGRYEARLVAWLVRNHLILSITAQKKDISDPDSHPRVRAPRRRSGASGLSVRADRAPTCAAPIPKLWNAWKAPLVRGVLRTHQAGAAPRTGDADRSGRTDPRNPGGTRARMIAAIAGGCDRARLVAVDRGVLPALHARGDRLAHQRAREPRAGRRGAAGRDASTRATAAAPAVLTYTPHRLHSFARTTAVLDQMGLNVVDARLITSANGFSLETYVVLEDNGAVIADPERIKEIERGLWRNLQQPEDSPLTVTRRAPRQVRMFSTPTQVNFSLDARNAPHDSRTGGRRPPGSAVRGRQGLQDRAESPSTAPRS